MTDENQPEGRRGESRQEFERDRFGTAGASQPSEPPTAALDTKIRRHLTRTIGETEGMYCFLEWHGDHELGWIA